MQDRPVQSIVTIDIARAIAALGVFYYHQHVGSVIAHYSGINWLNWTDIFGSTYAVPLFFLISGYCIHLSNIKYLKNRKALPLKDYYIRRLLRIYPAYLVALIFSIAVNYITKQEAVNKPDLFIHLFLLQGFTLQYFNSINVVLWTISIEMAFYVLYPLFYYLRLKFSLNYALLFSFIISCMSIGYYFTKGYLYNAQTYCVFNLWFAWCYGAYLADKKVLNEVDLEHPFLKMIYTIILLVFVLLKGYPQPGWQIVNYQLNILIWTAPLLWLLNQEQWVKTKRSFLINTIAAIGLSSYSLYLFHDPLIAFKNFLVHQFLPARLQPTGVLIGLLFIPFITWLSYLHIEKPFMVKRKSLVNA